MFSIHAISILVIVLSVIGLSLTVYHWYHYGIKGFRAQTAVFVLGGLLGIAMLIWDF